MKKILYKTDFKPFDWVDIDQLADSKGEYMEIYSDDQEGLESFRNLFFELFQSFTDQLTIGHLGRETRWGDFCIDTWNIHTDSFDYSVEGKDKNSAKYLHLLNESDIEPEYAGYCGCRDWSNLLKVLLPCVISGIAPYSPLIYSFEHQFMFYFHHSLSIGLRYLEYNFALDGILKKSLLMGNRIEKVSQERVNQVISNNRKQRK